MIIEGTVRAVVVRQAQEDQICAPGCTTSGGCDGPGGLVIEARHSTACGVVPGCESLAIPWRRSSTLIEALDLTTPAGRAMAGLLTVFAEFEREILRERVRALEHARQNRKGPGRSATAALHADHIRKLYCSGLGKSAIAHHLDIGRTLVRRIVQSQRVES